MLHLRKRGATWYARGVVAGQTVSVTTGCSDRRAAEAFARALERDLADPAGAARRAGEATTLQAAVDLAAARYDADARTGRRSVVTAAFYRRKWGQLLRVLGASSSLARVDLAAVRRYVDQRRDEGMSDHTVVKEVTALRVALLVARVAGLWAGDPDALVPGDLTSDYQPRTRALTLDEVQRLVGALTPPRAAWVGLAVGAGAELAALLRAERGDYDAKAGLVRVRGSKRDTRDRTVPVVLPACRALVELAWQHGAGKGALLLSPWGKNWRDLQAACARAGIAPVSLHDLRRTWAHWHLEAGCSYDDVARGLGHASTAMLHKVYGRLPPASLRDRMAASVGQPVANNELARAQKAQASQGPEMTKAPVLHGLSGCRRSDLNQRPWDYDSQGRDVAKPLFLPWSGDGRSHRERPDGQPVARPSRSAG